MKNALTVDVEDYYMFYEKRSSRLENGWWTRFQPRIVENVDRLLSLFARFQVRATFFILGYEAERFPEMVRKIADQGHEIGSHGYSHHFAFKQTEDEFRDDVRRSRRILEDASGREVVAYRAPTFSIGQTSWGFRVLAEEGYRFDASVFPIRHDVYGDPDAPPFVHKIQTEAGEIYEFPSTTTRIGRRNFPVGGGGYFRLFPWSFTKILLSKVQKERPFIFYIHPWELDPGQPTVPETTFKNRLRHRIGLRRTEAKMSRMLQKFAFAPMTEVVRECEAESPLLVVRDKNWK